MRAWILVLPAALAVPGAACDAAQPGAAALRDAGPQDGGRAPGAAAPRVTDCDPDDPERFTRYYRDADGDGFGDDGRTACDGAPWPAGFVPYPGDCDDGDPERGPRFYERFGDGIDSNCDGQDDPRMLGDPCSCGWVTARGMPESIACGDGGLDPGDAADVVSGAALGEPTCARLPDLELSFVLQCANECLGVPIYISVANVGGARAPPASVQLHGQFRAAPPDAPIPIAPLEPGERTPLIELLATGDYRAVIELEGEQCSTANDAVALDAYDAHCGFYP